MKNYNTYYITEMKEWALKQKTLGDTIRLISWICLGTGIGFDIVSVSALVISYILEIKGNKEYKGQNIPPGSLPPPLYKKLNTLGTFFVINGSALLLGSVISTIYVNYVKNETNSIAPRDSEFVPAVSIGFAAGATLNVTALILFIIGGINKVSDINENKITMKPIISMLDKNINLGLSLTL